VFTRTEPGDANNQIIMKSILVDLWSPSVMREFHQVAKPTPPVLASWAPHRVEQEGSAHLIRVSQQGALAEQARWGRSSQEERRYMDPRSATSVRRGLLLATGFIEVIAGSEKHERFFQHWNVTSLSKAWFALGCCYDEGLDGIEFAVLTIPAGPDLRGTVDREPLIVPPAYWSEWINPRSSGAFEFVMPPGTFALEQL
jgi:putative SOS response-associated peptidase YedK